MSSAAEGAAFSGELRKVVEGLKSAGWRAALEGAEKGAWLGELCRRSREAVLSEAGLVSVSPPVVLAGDTHGQYADLRLLFCRMGWPPETRWLFLGDYVDRGPNSIEVVVLLLSLKLLYPDAIWILRGNHEAQTINHVYGFYDECKRRFGESLWRDFGSVFDCLPFCALVGGRILAMHGGLSSELRSWAQLERLGHLRRPTDVPDCGPLCDLLWADPDPTITGFAPSRRNVSFHFGPDVATEFTTRMGLDLIVRAHQVEEDGYSFFANQRLITVFSAPNYCGEYNNAAAVLSVDAKLLCSIHVFRLFSSRLAPMPALSPTLASPPAPSHFVLARNPDNGRVFTPLPSTSSENSLA